MKLRGYRHSAPMANTRSWAKHAHAPTHTACPPSHRVYRHFTRTACILERGYKTRNPSFSWRIALLVVEPEEEWSGVVRKGRSVSLSKFGGSLFPREVCGHMVEQDVGVDHAAWLRIIRGCVRSCRAIIASDSELRHVLHNIINSFYP